MAFQTCYFGFRVNVPSPSAGSGSIDKTTKLIKGDGAGAGVDSGISTGDIALKAPLASPTFTGTVTLPSGQALTAPVLGTPASGNLSNCTSSGQVLTAPVLGTPASGTLTNCAGLPESGVTNLTSDLALKSPIASPTFTGTVTFPSGQALIAPVLGTPTSGTLTNCTGLPESGVTSLTSDLALKAPLASPTFTGTTTFGGGAAVLDVSSGNGTISASGGGNITISAPTVITGAVKDSASSFGTNGQILKTNGLWCSDVWRQ